MIAATTSPPLDPTTAPLVEQLLTSCPPSRTERSVFLGHQFDLGLAWVHAPNGRGGLGLPSELQRAVDIHLSRAGAPNPIATNSIGMGMAAPTLLRHGTPQQQDRYLRPLFTGDEVWCQLFSEPGAGSDLASLSSRAALDGDCWRVNGQKVWTTLAHVAHRAILVARTNPDVPKHVGLTYFALDMTAPGVEVVALRQLTGEAEFNEVYLNDVAIPDADRIGGIGEGWKVAMTTLSSERVSIGGNARGRGSGPIGEAITVWRQAADRTAVQRDRLMALWIRAEVLRLTNMRGAARRSSTPGPEGSIAKLATSELNQDIYALCIELLGLQGQLYESYEFRRPDASGRADSPQQAFLRAVANTIEGGSSEVMRNILGERILGLPADVRVDKELPWNQVPR